MKHIPLPLLCLAISLAPAHAQSPEQAKATIAYLRSLQTKEGGFTAKAGPADKSTNPVSLRATSSALRALKYFGGQPKDRESSKRFVAGCSDKASGGFADTPRGKPDITSTAVGLMALVELEMPLEPYRDAGLRYLDEHAKSFEDIRIAAAGLEAVHAKSAQAKAWLDQIGKMRNKNGTYGQDGNIARDTGGAVVAVLRLGGEVSNRDVVLKALKAGQRDDGGFSKDQAQGSDLETTYRIMRAFVMLKDRPDDVKSLRAFIGRCRNDDGGYGIAPGQPSTAGSTYFAAIILHWLTEDLGSGPR
jgi:prenyltransferase beta subunit